MFSTIPSGAESFLFTSCWKSLVAEGRFLSVTTPARDGEWFDGAFQQAAREAFATARASGITHPLLVGAIPFDTTQPSALFIPRHTHFLERRLLVTASGHLTLETTGQKAVPEKAIFTSMVVNALKAIETGSLNKVVLSRLIDITTARPLQPAALVNRLIALNPGCHHFYLPLSDGTTLIGASPELLLRKSGRHFASQPLAGSARRNLNSPQRDVEIGQKLMQSPKDRHEHQLVIQAMWQRLQPRSITIHLPSQPVPVTTAQLWHLATKIEGEVASEQENSLSLACLLHPTPALSGHPQVAARRLIAQLEPFDRQLFGGLVGWCDEEGNGEWAVCIRCATLAGQRIRLFAGAGIVSASSPQAEWNETEVKFSTMLKVFGLQ
ncbi:isochorismate synthase [Erwinia tracheiphila]|uniref:isochorismate synthase n=1 Tax=Erwinia tracheiphila TaxID=65700 RepID=A0A345CSK9_9GAMM|nr:isochorismate synthase [Erwinia tracheiphila]AXF76426.1 isochorismate synthase [Erwinia tracheiphila]UIA84911.1 isochorismate synthase [Erwinia tracheiphila]UIA93508.1 isochorismate synthase [Erwinia tracheiphila]